MERNVKGRILPSRKILLTAHVRQAHVYYVYLNKIHKRDGTVADIKKKIRSIAARHCLLLHIDLLNWLNKLEKCKE